MNTIQFIGALELGLIYGLVAIAVYLTFRVIDFRDMTVDGSLPLGAALTAVLILKGYNPCLAMILATLGGFLAGWLTGVLSVRWKIMGLLSSILVMTALYSVNLRIMGIPNISLMNQDTIFTNNKAPLFLLIGIVILIAGVALYGLKTQFGLGLRSIGKNQRMASSLGIQVGFGQKLVLGLSNGMVAFTGSLLAQLQGFADASMGTGAIVIGLVSVVIGETLFRQRYLTITLIGCIVGSILYRIVIALALNVHFLSFKSSDINIITAIIVIIAMAIPALKKKGASI